MKYFGRFLSSIFFLSLLLALLILSFRTNIINNVNQKNISNDIDNINIVELIKEYDKNFFNDLYEEADKFGVSKSNVDKVLNSKNVKDIFKNYIVNNYEYLLYGKNYEQINVEKVHKTIENELKQFYLPQKIIEQIENIIFEKTDSYINIMNRYNLANERIDNIDYIRLMFSNKGNRILSSTIIFSIIAMIICLFSVYEWAYKSGKACIIVGIFDFIIGMSINNIIVNINSALTNFEITFKSLENGLVSFSIILIVLGLVQVAYAFIMDKAWVRCAQNKSLLDEKDRF